MKKVFLIIGVVALIFTLLLSIVGCFSKQDQKGTQETGETDSQGISGVDELGLIPKTGDPDWDIIDGEIGGVLLYSTEGEEFGYCLEAYGLTATTDFSLIYFADPWPGTGGCLIASGTSDTMGGLFLIGEVDLGIDIPVVGDDNYPAGGKLWLVLTADYDGTQMTARHPESYLYEDDLITYIDTDD